jgi:tetratricopeptide (TPR) repeat protein
VAADSKAKHLHDAEKYVLQGKIQQAIGEYLKITKIDPDDVLTLNTIGDLYLRQNNIPEANKYFARVAENYVRNNFFLKAIAVYRKILSADANNLDINATIAALYAKQGLSIEARNQYLKVSVLLEKAGRSKEVLDVYEKIVEIDPANVAIQRKLAEMHLAAGENQSAHTRFANAAKAQIKARDLTGAMDSLSRALMLDPLDLESLSGLLECCQELGNISPALEQLKRTLDRHPESLQVRELLGQAHLAANEPEEAVKAFQMVVSMDESRYEGFFGAAQALIDKESWDQAISCLDAIIPILITRRETERAAQLYEQMLERRPAYILPLIKLASIHSATGDQERYLEALDKIADYYLEQKCLIEALEYLEKILHVAPQSEKHRELHQKTFAEVYPDTPYVPPAEPVEDILAANPIPVRTESGGSAGPASSEIVEVDLLLNYGLKDKALSILRNLETRDPNDKDVRIRLLSLFKANDKIAEAAEQCLLLAVLCRRSGDEDAAQEYLKEAGELAPDLAEREDLEEFARLHGITAVALSETSAEPDLIQSDGEVDLSADLMDIFFAGDQEPGDGEESESQPSVELTSETIAEEFPSDLPQTPAKSVEEQLQEVDFYIRLGFYDEALAKLDELAKISPDNPELAERYKKLGGVEPVHSGAAESVDSPETELFSTPPETDPSRGADAFAHLDMEEASGGFVMSEPEPIELVPELSASFEIPPAESGPVRESEEARPEAAIPLETDRSDFQANEMFADLMEETGNATDPNITADSFEDHFSLGTAYREMELLDEAVLEFQNALKAAGAQKNSQKIIQCCGMLSTCFLNKNMPSSALRWCQTGLSIADISSHEAMALRYDMGTAHSMSGSKERALECFEQIFGMDPGYRDVAQKIDELKSGLNRHAP